MLAGDDDPIVPVMNGRILARCIPDARLHVVRGGGHLFLLERPAEIADLVASFLSSATHHPNRRDSSMTSTHIAPRPSCWTSSGGRSG